MVAAEHRRGARPALIARQVRRPRRTDHRPSRRRAHRKPPRRTDRSMAGHAARVAVAKDGRRHQGDVALRGGRGGQSRPRRVKSGRAGSTAEGASGEQAGVDRRRSASPRQRGRTRSARRGDRAAVRPGLAGVGGARPRLGRRRPRCRHGDGVAGLRLRGRHRHDARTTQDRRGRWPTSPHPGGGRTVAPPPRGTARGTATSRRRLEEPHPCRSSRRPRVHDDDGRTGIAAGGHQGGCDRQRPRPGSTPRGSAPTPAGPPRSPSCTPRKVSILRTSPATSATRLPPPPAAMSATSAAARPRPQTPPGGCWTLVRFRICQRDDAVRTARLRLGDGRVSPPRSPPMYSPNAT